MKEIVLLDNGVIVFDQDNGFFGGSSKAKNIRCGGMLKMVSEAKKRLAQ